ncbi:MAG TPA: hypothetical protein VKV40_07595, partial [Ktedonobacteraceae bacterium]|nr:hypothetical protein [Ktedonobacteraceae bacterium]
MDEEERLVIGYWDGQYVIVDAGGSVVAALAPGAAFEVWMRGQWQAVSLHSGGYRGCYYLTTKGERGRLAGCMSVRLMEASASSDEVPCFLLEQVRRLWMGKLAHSKVALAGGFVSGEVREVTQRGMVLF